VSDEADKKKRRRAGEGSVEPLKSGRFRVRVPLGSHRRFDPHKTYETFESADAVRAALVKRFVEEGRGATGSITFLAYGELVLERRKGLGIRDAKGEKSIFDQHLATANFAKWPIINVRRRDVKRWLDEMHKKKAAPGHGHKKAVDRPLSRSRIKNSIHLLSAIFAEALEDEYIDGNPALVLRVAKESRTDEPWTYLTHEEQQALLLATPDGKREILAVALCTGVRLEELWLLHRADVHLDARVPYLTVRYGKRDKGKLFPPKGKKIRDVPLLAYALPAMRAWLSREQKKNRFALVFPGSRGGFRAQKKALPGFHKFVAAAGISRAVRWHDLRHTCASSLVAGWWGRPWRLEEVCAMLGHSSIRVTERYAHLAPSMLQMAAAATGSLGLPTTPLLLGPATSEAQGNPTPNAGKASFPKGER